LLNCDWKVKEKPLKDHRQKILVVDDEKMIRWSLGEALRGWGYEPIQAETATAGLAAFDADQPAAILLDINLPDGSGLEVLRQIRHRQADAVVIMITANVLVDETIAALRGGAYDFIGKPINLEELQVAIRNGIEAGRLRKEVSLFRRERARQFNFNQIVGESPAMREMLALSHKVAESEVSSVLLQGESGTGKDLVAKAIHYHSSRSDKPFVAINCAALPGTLIESELFGYEKGAFTDAKARKEGLFEQAEGGTLFLDEIGELELSLQAKLLRVLETGEFERVGSSKTRRADVRILTATNAELQKEIEAGKFREDLFFRLNTIQIHLPPLRERAEDIPFLAEEFLGELRQRYRKQIQGFHPDSIVALKTYAWPGNVRELRNLMERVAFLSPSDRVEPSELAFILSPDPEAASAACVASFSVALLFMSTPSVMTTMARRPLTPLSIWPAWTVASR
jgi:DNA-binding NtrC family response regulator